MKRCTWGMVCVLGCAVALPARAAENTSANAPLLAQAQKLMAAGRHAQQCAKLEASETVDADPDADADRLFELGDCYAKSGKTASAWVTFRASVAAAHDAGQRDRERSARARALQLERQLSYLTIVVWQGQDVQVTRDGVPLEAATLSTAIPVDPGDHVINAAAPGKRPFSTHVKVPAGEHVSFSVPILSDEPSELPVLQSAHALVGPPPLDATAPRTDDDSAGAVQRVIAIAAAAVGVAGVATGGVFGLKAASNWSDAKSDCNPYPHCGESGARLSREAKQSGDISTVAFIAGGASLATGVLLWFSAPHKADERGVALALGPAAFDVHGKF